MQKNVPCATSRGGGGGGGVSVLSSEASKYTLSISTQSYSLSFTKCVV